MSRHATISLVNFPCLPSDEPDRLTKTPGVSSDELIREFGLETMRDYFARARRDRQRALQGTYLAPRSTP